MPGFKTEERKQAIERGVEFVYRIACGKKSLREDGPYFICFFELMASTSRSSSLRRKASEIGRELALRWHVESPALSHRARQQTIGKFVIGSTATERFGVSNSTLKEQIRQKAKRFSANKVLGFDPTSEPPPDNQPERCECGLENSRSRKKCKNCKKRLTMKSKYDLWSEALCTTYWSECCGVVFGARYVEVIKWLPQMRPYKRGCIITDAEFLDIVYAVTHVVYTLNGYNRYRLSRRLLPAEFAFLKANLREAIDFEDPDMVGEFVDTLKAFGLNDSHRTIRLGINYLLSRQNDDGSWGDMDEDDNFTRFHATWAAIDGLREYAWRGERLTYPELIPLLRQWARTK